MEDIAAIRTLSGLSFTGIRPMKKCLRDKVEYIERGEEGMTDGHI
jgi:hypothetical protein